MATRPHIRLYLSDLDDLGRQAIVKRDRALFNEILAELAMRPREKALPVHQALVATAGPIMWPDTGAPTKASRSDPRQARGRPPKTRNDPPASSSVPSKPEFGSPRTHQQSLFTDVSPSQFPASLPHADGEAIRKQALGNLENPRIAGSDGAGTSVPPRQLDVLPPMPRDARRDCLLLATHIDQGVQYVAGIPPLVAPDPELPLIQQDEIGQLGAGRIEQSPEEFTGSPQTSALERKTLQLFEFVRSWRDMARPPICAVEKYEWALPLRTLPVGEHQEVTNGLEPEARDEGIILRVRRPAKMPNAPSLPPVLAEWVVPRTKSWKSSLGYRISIVSEVELNKEEAAAAIADGTPPMKTTYFTDDPQRVGAWENWVVAWCTWAESARTHDQIEHLYSTMFALNSRLEGRSHEVELMITSAEITWKTPGGTIHHPLVLKRVGLEFNASGAEFILRDVMDTSEFAVRALTSAPLRGSQYAIASKLHEQTKPHPLDLPSVRSLITGIMNHWFASLTEDQVHLRPTCVFSPTIYLRPTGTRVGQFIDSIITDLKAGGDAPDIFHWLTSETTPPKIDEEASTEPEEQWAAATSYIERQAVGQQRAVLSQSPDPDENIHFTKASNDEQRRIIQLQERQSAIVVQGPPGTGKTHTIANIIGHGLSQGWRILVTSMTAKALGEVRQRVVEELRPLCIPYLDVDAEGQQALQSSLQAILAKSTHIHVPSLLKERDGHARRRTELLKRRRGLRVQLLAARRSEIEPIVYRGANWMPVAASKAVASAGKSDLWIPGPLAIGGICALSPADLSALYHTQLSIHAWEEDAHRRTLPPLAELPAVSLLHALRAAQAASTAQANVLHDFRVRRHWKEAGAFILVEIDAVLLQINTALKNLTVNSDSSQPKGAIEQWRVAAIEAGIPRQSTQLLRSTDMAGSAWTSMLTEWTQAEGLYSLAVEHDLEWSPELGTQPDDAAHQMTTAILAHFDRGGDLKKRLFGLLGHPPEWRPFLETWRLKGQPLSTRLHVEVIQTILAYRLANGAFVRRYQALIGDLGGPSVSVKHPAINLGEVRPIVLGLLAWHKDHYESIAARLVQLGFPVEEWIAAQQHTNRTAAVSARVHLLAFEVLPVLSALAADLRLTIARDRWKEAQQTIGSLSAQHPAAQPLASLLHAWTALDVDAWETHRAAYERLLSRRDTVLERWRLLELLGTTAPGWSEAMRARRVPHHQDEMPGVVEDAWRFRVLIEELDHRQALSLVQINQELSALEKDLEIITRKLVEANAWLAQQERLDGSRHLALKQWAQIMSQLKGGKVKNAAALTSQAMDLSRQAMGVVPVWIMPLARVFDVLSPDPHQRFDLVIVDEASQADMSGLPILYLGKRVMVVGDDQQVTPSAVGQQIEDIQKLQGQWLSEFNASTMFDGKASLFGLAKVHAGKGVTSLREHYRCLPDIIAFSNALCYIKRSQGLRPLRDAKSSKLQQSVVPYRVHGNATQDKVNIEEARAITALLAAMIDHPLYAGCTFGVIAMVGSRQEQVLEELIRTQLKLSDLDFERLKGGGGSTRRLCGQPPDFQGDERDVILISVVDSPHAGGIEEMMASADQGSVPGGPLTMKRAEMFVQRYNVAASRAKDQMWVVHSLDPDSDVKPGDLRKSLIDHARNPGALARLQEEQGLTTDSPFEKDVLDVLVGAGYRVETQYPVGSLRIDLVVTDGERRLAVECDGEKFHGPDRLQADLDRQRILERLGHIFHRIRGSSWYRDRTGAIDKLFQAVQQRGIQPRVTDGLSAVPSEPLIADIERRAQACLIDWGWLTLPVPSPAAMASNAESADLRSTLN